MSSFVCCGVALAAGIASADGAMYKTYLASDGNGGYTATDLAPTTATFAGALKVTAGQEGAMTAPLRIKAFSATNGIGISESNVSMTDADAGTPYVWMPYLDNSQLWLRCRNSRAGFAIIVR